MDTTTSDRIVVAIVDEGSRGVVVGEVVEDGETKVHEPWKHNLRLSQSRPGWALKARQVVLEQCEMVVLEVEEASKPVNTRSRSLRPGRMSMHHMIYRQAVQRLTTSLA